MTPRTAKEPVRAMEILDPGLQTTIQDYPGRVGRQSLGFSPSGPADPLAFRLANLLVGNHLGTAALEIPLGRFQASMLCSTTIALCGPEADITLNDEPVPLWESIPVRAGDHLGCGVIRGPGHRLYLAVAGGISTPAVFGSRSTFLVAGIGGYDGRALDRADVLEIGTPDGDGQCRRRVPPSLRPGYADHWEIEVIRGPHADPDFLTPEDYAEFVGSRWRCDLSSDRVAVRFNPHRFRWARSSGEIAGPHPSNVLDWSYPLGAVLAYGDVLTILGPDSHTSGGFAVIATVASAALWKVGQLRPGRDTVTFREVDLEQASALDEHTRRLLDVRNLDVR